MKSIIDIIQLLIKYRWGKIVQINLGIINITQGATIKINLALLRFKEINFKNNLIASEKG